MKIFLLLILSTLSFQVLSLDLDQEKIKVAYINLPSEPMFNPQDRNYSTTFYSPYNQYELQSAIENHFHIEGFDVYPDNTNIRLDFKFQELIIKGTDIRTKKIEKKDSNGNIKVTYKYTPIITYRTSAKVLVSYASGTNKTYSFGNSNSTHNGVETSSRRSADSFISGNLQQIKNELNRKFITASVKSVKGKMNRLHGYQPVHTTDHLIIMDSKKYPEYNDYKKFQSEIVNIFNKMSPFKPLMNPNNAEKINRAITFLEKIPANYPKNKRSHKKMRYASFYNLAILNHYLENFDKASDYYQKVITNDYHEGQSKRNLKTVDRLKTLYSINKVTTSHFQIQKANTGNNNQAQSSQNFIYLDADILTNNNQSTEGKIELADNVSDIIYELQSLASINFKHLNDADEVTVTTIDSSTIQSIQLEESKLQNIEYLAQKDSPAVKGLALELFTSNKISLYHYNNEIILKKATEKLGQSTSATAYSFGFKKKLSQYLSTCQKMQADIKSGKYKNNIDSLTLAMGAYTQCL